MGFSLIDIPCEFLYFKGRKIRLTLYFDRVLKCMEILRDDTLCDDNKIFLALAMLTPNSYKIAKKDKASLLSFIFKEYINSPQKSADDNIPCFDFFKDAALIYAAFLSAYNIDLHSCHGRLHWLDFTALFSSLPKDTKFYEIMLIRSTPVPAPNKYNLDYIQNLRYLKACYALDDTYSNSKLQFSSSLKSLADDFRRQAEIKLMKG